MSHVLCTLSIRASFIMLLLSAAGCLEYETTTALRSDGSFLRTVTVTGDSTSLHSWNFRIPVDTSWTVLERTKVDDRKWILRAERVFTDSDAWTIWADGLDRRTLQCSVFVERQFRFFTTRYRLSETIASYNPFTLVPLTDYISPGELDMFLRFEVMKESYPSRGDSLALDDASDRFQEWETRTRAESFFAALERSLTSPNELTADRLNDLKEDLVQYYLADGGGKEFSREGLLAWAKHTRVPQLIRVIGEGTETLDDFYDDIDYVKDTGGDSYVSHVIMPGEITFTNGRQDGPSTASWDNYIAYAYVSDFTMVAESSVVNIWAIVLALGIIVGAPILVWVAWMVRKKSE